MHRTRVTVALAVVLFGLGRPAIAANDFTFIEQIGSVTATADGNTVTEILPRWQPTTISVTAGTPEAGMDYGMATLTSSVHGNRIHLIMSATVGEWGHEGSAEARIRFVFSVDQNRDYTVQVEKTDAVGNGYLGYRSFIMLSNDDGIIFSRNSGGGYNSCNLDHPNYVTLCQNRTLTPGVYYFEMLSSAYAPSDCDSCKGYAVSANAELVVSR